MQKKKPPFIILRDQFPQKRINFTDVGKRSPEPPLYIESLLKEVDIPPERTLVGRKMFVVASDDNMSPSTNSTSEEYDRYPYENQRNRNMNITQNPQSMIYDPSHSLRLINGIAQQREFSSEDYELLLHLDEAHRIPPKSTGLEDSEINSFRFWKVTKKMKPDGSGEEPHHKCSICLHDVKPGQIARELPCSHIFHKNCIDKWLKSDIRCPLDNQNIKEML